MADAISGLPCSFRKKELRFMVHFRKDQHEDAAADTDFHRIRFPLVADADRKGVGDGCILKRVFGAADGYLRAGVCHGEHG